MCGFQVTDSKILQEYITQEGHKLEIAPKPPMAVTNAVSWRSEGLKYRKNEVFLDVVESVNLLVSASGNVLRSEIVGAIKMRVYLSGMPELRLGLNDKVCIRRVCASIDWLKCGHVTFFVISRPIAVKDQGWIIQNDPTLIFRSEMMNLFVQHWAPPM